MHKMLLHKIAQIQPGYLSRKRVEPRNNGSHFLLQARDVDSRRHTYRTDTLIRFNPVLSRRDWLLKKGDVLFMARGARNYSVLLQDIPDTVLAAACFFIVRVSNEKVLPNYLCWYLNQASVQNYLSRYSGKGVHMPVIRRSVLENVDIPIPLLETQTKIVELDSLLQEEKSLLNKLVEKSEKLLTAASLNAIRKMGVAT
jgi:hypothetical protein